MRKFIQAALAVAVIAAVSPSLAAAKHDGDNGNNNDRRGIRAFFNFNGFRGRDREDELNDDRGGDKRRINDKRLVAGTVTDVDSSSFDLKTTNGATYTVTVANATLKRPFSNDIVSLSDIAVNSRVAVKGTVSGNTITADWVQVSPPNTHPAVAKGTVTAVNGNTLTVQSEHKGIEYDVTVDTDSNTQVTNSDGSASTMAAVEVGTMVKIKGFFQEITDRLKAVKIRLFS